LFIISIIQGEIVMKRRDVVLACVLLVFVVVAMVFFLPISKPFTEKERVEIEKEFAEKTEVSDYCNRNGEEVIIKTLPIFEIPKKNPFFRIVRISESGKSGGYEFTNYNFGIEFSMKFKEVIEDFGWTKKKIVPSEESLVSYQIANLVDFKDWGMEYDFSEQAQKIRRGMMFSCFMRIDDMLHMLRKKAK
jgi:hypothetical protein